MAVSRTSGFFADQVDQDRGVIDQPPAAALAIGEIEQAPRNRAVDLLAGLEPDAGDKGFARQNLAFARRQRLRRVAALVFQQMPEILIGRDAEQPAAPLETDGKLKIGHISLAVAAAQPVLLLGQIVVTNADAMQPAQHRLGGTEIGDVAEWLCQMQRDAIDKAPNQSLPPGP